MRGLQNGTGWLSRIQQWLKFGRKIEIKRKMWLWLPLADLLNLLPENLLFWEGMSASKTWHSSSSAYPEKMTLPFCSKLIPSLCHPIFASSILSVCFCPVVRQYTYYMLDSWVVSRAVARSLAPKGLIYIIL